MVSEIRKKFANRLRMLRNAQNLSQEQLALLCKIDRSYIGRIEQLKRNPSLEILDRIAKGLNMQLYELLKFDS